MTVAADEGENKDEEVEEAWPNGSREEPRGDEVGALELDDGPPPRDSQTEPRRVCCVSPVDVEEEELSAVGGATSLLQEMAPEDTTEQTEAIVDVEEDGASCTVPETPVEPQEWTEEQKEEPLGPPVNGTPPREGLVNGHNTEDPEDSQQMAPATSEGDGTTSPAENSSGQEEVPPCAPCQSKDRTLLTNGFTDSPTEESQVLEVAPTLESSTETLTDDGCGRADICPARQLRIQDTAENGGGKTLNGLAPRTSAVPPAPTCNGERSSSDVVPPNRQASACGSSYGHAPRSVCALHRCCHLAGRPAVSPEQPGRGHLDDDGLTLHADVVQQRLRQIEAGHQMEVETLKKQLQELWSRLENQQYGGAHCLNGDMGDDLVGVEPPVGQRGGVMVPYFNVGFGDKLSSEPVVLLQAGLHGGL